jgi:N-acetylglucosaminyldiphosphoundecaprenol N-acetyl-beta-D-mannosaminyltransferase
MLTTSLWCKRRSRIAVTITGSWNSSAHSLKDLFEVITVLPRIGKNGKVFEEISFPISRGNLFGKVLSALKFPRFGALYNILKGDMSFIGPRAAAPDEVNLREGDSRRRLTVRPGLVCTFWVRRRVNIAFDSESVVDAEYVETHTIRGDFGILVRSLISAMYGNSAPAAPSGRVTILGIPIDNLTMDDAVDVILRRTEFKKQSRVSFVNADCANISWKNQEYMRTLVECDVVLADGIGMKLAGRILKQNIRENVNGTDMFPRLCKGMEAEGKSIFLLGGREGVPEAVAAWIAERYPNLNITGVQHGYYSPEDEAAVIERINACQPDVLIVAFGAPRQEIWIKKNLEATGAKVAIGVGGLLDFYSGRIPRAPLWMRELGIEWVYRFIQEPGRLWKRYLVGNTVFMMRFLVKRGNGRNFRSDVKGINKKCAL